MHATTAHSKKKIHEDGGEESEDKICEKGAYFAFCVFKRHAVRAHLMSCSHSLHSHPPNRKWSNHWKISQFCLIFLLIGASPRAFCERSFCSHKNKNKRKLCDMKTVGTNERISLNSTLWIVYCSYVCIFEMSKEKSNHENKRNKIVKIRSSKRCAWKERKWIRDSQKVHSKNKCVACSG